MSNTIAGWLERVARRHPRAEALVDVPRAERITYQELWELSRRAARGFLALGLEPGDHLSLWAPNQPEWVICQMAAAQAGLVLTNVDTGIDGPGLARLLDHSDCRVLVLAPGPEGGRQFWDTLASLDRSQLPRLEWVVLLADQAPAGALAWPELLERGRGLPRGELARRREALTPQDVAYLFYTSGSTGPPKGVMTTHWGLMQTARASARNQGLDQKSRLCVSIPLSHVFGCACLNLAALAVAATLVIPSRRPRARASLDAVEQESCTALYGAPTAFIEMLELQKKSPRDLGSLRTGIMAGAQCPMEVMRRVVEELGLAGILVGYGQTEASTWISQTRADDPLELRVSTVGRPIPGVEVKIVDPASGRELAPGQVGELCTRGFNMKGYYRQPQATAQALDPQGWLHTGDLASQDPQGYLRIAGRLKEVILSAGRVVYPAQVEEVIFTHPAVALVQVFGIPHPELGQEVAAWVKLEPGARVEAGELLSWCARHLEPEQAPRHLKVVEEFPMTSLGKIPKYRLSRLYARELGRKN